MYARVYRFFQTCGNERGLNLFWLCYGDYRGTKKLKQFLRYVKARAEHQNREEAYRIFVTESLKGLPQGKWFTVPYTEIIQPKKIETKTGKEVADEVAEKIGFKIDWGR